VYSIEPSLVLPMGGMVRASAGLLAQWSHTGNNDGRFISALRDTLLGAQEFGQVGARVGLEIDTRDRPINAIHGARLAVAGRLMPAVWDVPETFGSAEAEASTFLSAPIGGTPTLALRAGGKKVWGRYPFYESAFLGGRNNLRGFHSERFAGDASLYGTAELRITVGRSYIALPGEWGLFGNVDAGRVYVDGESPGGWHTGVGGGLWLAFLDRSNAASAGITFTDEGTLVRVGVGLGF
jgi:outer membrane protein assembly factor BamA